MFTKIARVTVLSLSMMVLPGVIVACSGGDDSAAAKPGTGTGEIKQNDPPAALTSSCKSVSKHDDALCKGRAIAGKNGYLLLDEVNDETCEALGDATDDAKATLKITVPSSASKGSPGSFSWGKSTAQITPMKRILDLLEPSAHADGRTDGVVYMLVLQDKNCADVVRVLTKKTSWTATSEDWAKLAAAPGPISATVVMGTLDNSAIKDGSEVVASKAAAFQIK